MSSRPVRVLIVHPDPDLLTDLQWHCQEMGLDTSVTWDCHEAHRLAADGGFDLIAVGEHTPEVCSAQLLRCLRCLPHAAPCLVFRRGPRYPFESEFLKALGAADVLEHRRSEELARCIGNWADRLTRDASAAAAV